MSNTVAIVILNWNGKHLLERFLPSVIANSPQATIYVADNCSTDDSINFIQVQHPDLNLICNPCNYGYAGGYNCALENLKEDIIVLLNSDVECPPGWLLPLIQLMESDSTIGCCQPKIKDYHKKDYFEYAGAAGGFIDRYGYPFCQGRIFNTLEKDENQYNTDKDIFWASGACMVVRNDAFKKAEGFDPDFFAHMEEIDFCWRLKNLGYKIKYCSGSEVYHLGGGTLSKLSPKKTYLNFRNNLLMLLKNLNKKDLIQTILLRLVLDGIAGIKFLGEGAPAHTIAIVKAHFHTYGLLLKTKTKRKKSITKHHLKELTGVYNKMLIIDYYIKRKKTAKQLLEVPNSTSLSSKVFMDIK